MTLEETTRYILDAAEAQDLNALKRASKQRAAALAMLPSIPPAGELRDALLASIAAGDRATHVIRAIRQRLRRQSSRLANIDRGFFAIQRAAGKHRFDYHG